VKVSIYEKKGGEEVKRRVATGESWGYFAKSVRIESCTLRK
jgi:hypothetical protein